MIGLDSWSWVDWYILANKEHPLVSLRRWALGRGLRLAIAFALGAWFGTAVLA